MFGFQRNKKLLQDLQAYLRLITEVMDNFRAAMARLMQAGIDDEFEDLVNRTHQSESSADDMRRAIERDLYEKSLLPESRGDFLGLIETVDRLPGGAESVLFQILTQSVSIPQIVADEFQQLITISYYTSMLAIDEVTNLFGDRTRIPELHQQIDTNESLCDDLERKIITRLFVSECSDFHKILVKDIVVSTGDLSDLCELVSDRVTIFNIKQQL